jgi:RNA polymerase sigma factor (sigma-70 family)
MERAVSKKVVVPEQRFLLALYPDELSKQCLASPFAENGQTILGRLRMQIDAALDILGYRSRGILEMRYGLGDGHAYTLAEISEVFQLSRERVRQLQVKAMRRLRHKAVCLRNFLYELES